MVEQGTDEWRRQRAGKVTSSRVYDILPGKSGYKAARKNYMAELVIERLTGEPQDNGFTSAAMQWGIDTEPLARSDYEAINGVMVEETGFTEHPDILGFGGSPDGLVGDDGILEIKCPNSATHIDTIQSGKIKDQYFYQLSANIMVTGRKWGDFYSFDPRFPDNLCRFQERFYLSESTEVYIRQEVTKFLDELETAVKELEAYRGKG